MREVVEHSTFWDELKMAIDSLQPFSDYIHQVESDRPALGRCYQGLSALDKHVRACVPKWVDDDVTSSDGAATAIRTWERRYMNKHSGEAVG